MTMTIKIKPRAGGDKRYRVPKTAITERGLKKLIKDAVKDGKSQADWAREHGMTPQTVSAFLRETQTAGWQLPEVFGYRPQIVFLPLDEVSISHMNPPRKATTRTTKKVDATKPPVHKKDYKGRSEKERVIEKLKKRKK